MEVTAVVQVLYLRVCCTDDPGDELQQGHQRRCRLSPISMRLVLGAFTREDVVLCRGSGRVGYARASIYLSGLESRTSG